MRRRTSRVRSACASERRTLYTDTAAAAAAAGKRAVLFVCVVNGAMFIQWGDFYIMKIKCVVSLVVSRCGSRVSSTRDYIIMLHGPDKFTIQ